MHMIRVNSKDFDLDAHEEILEAS